MKTEKTLRRLLDAAGFRLSRKDGLYAIIDHQHGGTVHPMGVVGPHALGISEVNDWAQELTA